VLARQAPTLAVALNPFLEPTKEAGEGIPWRFVLALLLIILLLTAGGYVSRRLSGSFQTDQAQPSAQSQIAAGQLRAAQGLGRQQDGAVAKLARQLSRQAATEGLSALSQTAYQLANQAETHRCDTVRVLRDNLLHEVQQLDPPRQARYLEEYTVLDGRIKEACNKLRLRADEYDTWDQQ
jgi:HPt (histidine-containing phosphotransfer) domain-containing protein